MFRGCYIGFDEAYRSHKAGELTQAIPTQMERAGEETSVCVCLFSILVLGVTGVELGQGALRNPLQHLFGEDSHQLPADVQGLVHAPVLVGTCTQREVTNARYVNMTLPDTGNRSKAWPPMVPGVPWAMKFLSNFWRNSK